MYFYLIKMELQQYMAVILACAVVYPSFHPLHVVVHRSLDDDGCIVADTGWLCIIYICMHIMVMDMNV